MKTNTFQCRNNSTLSVNVETTPTLSNALLEFIYLTIKKSNKEDILIWKNCLFILQKITVGIDI
jgi:hypothetical protein